MVCGAAGSFIELSDTRKNHGQGEQRGNRPALDSAVCGWSSPAPDLWYLLSAVTGAVLELLPVGVLEQTYSTCIFSPSFKWQHTIYTNMFYFANSLLLSSLTGFGISQTQVRLAAISAASHVTLGWLTQSLQDCFSAGLLWRSDCVLCKWLILLLTAPS